MKKFKIGLSFPGKDRRYVRNVADALVDRNNFRRDDVFFDEWHESEFVGDDAATQLTEIFSTRCEMLVPFFSTHYKKTWVDETHWCGIEWTAMKVILSDPKKSGRVIPVRRDGTEIEGFNKQGLGINCGAKSGRVIASELAVIYANRFRDSESLEKDKDSDTVDSTLQYANEYACDFGFLIVADVSNSSSIKSDSLRTVIRRLWQFPDYLAKAYKKSGLTPTASGILDGLIIAVPVSVVGRDFRGLIDSCVEWINTFREENLGDGNRVAMRIAIHYGSYDWIKSPPLVVGRAPNECSRFVRIAGEHQIILSEELLRAWTTELGEGSLPNVTPRSHLPPWYFEQKPNTTSIVRLLNDQRLNNESPSIQQRIDQTSKAIYEILGQILIEFEDNLVGLENGISPGSIDTRVSIFAPDVGYSMLQPTEFRFPCPEFAVASKGLTSYSISDRKLAQGTVGLAFATNTLQRLTSLPVYSGKGKNYVNALKQPPWNVPEDSIHRFGRKARAFMAFPFTMTKIDIDSDLWPDGVVCIDTMNQLASVPLDEIDLILEDLRNRYETSLAALWRLRRST